MNKQLHSLVTPLGVALCIGFGTLTAAANVTVTPASGGSALSADTAATGGSGAWTALGAITITEGASTDFNMGTNITLVLKTPAGFEFNTAGTPDAAFTANRGIASAALAVTDATTLTVTLTVSNNTSLDVLTLGGTTAIEVRPTAGTPLATGRRIYRPSSGGGTATIAGITASADGTSGTSFGPLTEVVGAAAAIRVETLASGAGTVVPAQNRGAGTSLTVYSIVRDQFGNFITNIASDAWSLPVKTDGVVDGDLVAAGNAKSATFTAHLLGTGIIRATSGSLTTTDSGTLTVVPGAASKMVFTTAPQSLTAGVVSSVMTVQIQDVSGNPTNATSARTVTLTKSSAAGVFRDVTDTTTITSVVIPIGSSTASFLYRDTLAGSPVLTAASAGLTSGTQTQTVAVASAAMVRVETAANGSGVVVAAQNVTAGNSITGYAIVRDAFTNFIENIAADAWSLPIKTGGVQDADLVPAGDSKSAVFTGRIVGTATVRATSGALTPVDSGTLTVVAGAAAKLFVTLPGETFTAPTGNSGTPLDQTAGAAFVLAKLTCVDAFTNIVTTYGGNKTVAYTGPGGTATYTTAVNFSAGQSTTTLTTILRKAEATTITASSGSAPAVTGVASSSFTVNPNAFARLQLLVPGEAAAPGTTTGKTGTPGAQTADVPFNVTVNGVDTNWNVISAVADTVGITSSDANAVLPADAALAGGTQTFSVTLKTAGTPTVTATDVSDGAKTASTSPSITVNAGAFAKLQLLLPGETAAPGTVAGKTGTPTAQAAGSAFSVTVRGVDANWNLVTTAPGNTVAIQSTDVNATMPANNSLSSGTRSFSVTLKTAGTHSLTATNITDGTKASDTSPSFTLNPGALAKLQLLVPGESAAPGSATGKTGTPAAQSAGGAFSVTVNSVDANWNVVATNHVVAITSSDVNATLPSNAALVAGTQTFSVTLNTSGARTVTASDVTSVGITANTSPAITVATGPFTKLQLLLPGETAAPGTVAGKTGSPTARTAGTSFNVTVNAVDALWNLISTNDTVAITSGDANATLPANAALVAGTKSFAVTLKTSGTQTVTATDATDGGIAGSQGSALVNPAAASQLLIATQPSPTAVVGDAFAPQPVIHIADAYSNIRSNDALTVSAARIAGSGSLLGATNIAAIGGVATYTNLAHSVATNITIRFTSGVLTAVTSAPVAVSASSFARLLVLLPGEVHAPGTPTGKTGAPAANAGTNLPVRVLATDASFNLVDTVTDTVGLTATDANAVLPANVALINGTNTLDLLFKTAGSQTVTATDISDGTKTPGTGTVTVSPGTFVKLQILAPGETAAPGTTTGKSGAPIAQVAGVPFNVIINGVDADWNINPVANGSTHTVALTSTDPNATLATGNLASGTRTLSITLNTAGTNTITASHLDDPTKTASTSPGIAAGVGAFAKLQLLLPGETAVPGSTTGKTGTPTAQVAGTPFNVTVNAVDATWNPISTNDTVRITSTDPHAVLPPNTALVNGSAALALTLRTAGARTVTVSNVTHAAITPNTSPSVTVNPGAYSQLQVLMPGETAVAGTTNGKTGTVTAQVAGTGFTTLTVNAVDSLWNIVPTNVTVAVTSSDTNAVLPANSALGTDGTKANFAFTFKTAGTQTITATDTGNAGRTNTGSLAVVSPGAFTKLQIIVPGETAAPGTATGRNGAPLIQTSNLAFNVTVRSVDANWNLISTNDVVRITSNDTNAILPATNALATGAQTFSVTLNTVGTNLTVTASNVTHTAITPAVSSLLTVNTKLSQTITFGPLADKTFGNPPFGLSATASSGLPVSFSIVSGPATISDGTNVTLTGVGTVTVRASQAGDATYNPALSVDQSFNVASGNALPTIAAIPNQTVVIDRPTDAYHLTVSDAETPELSLQLRGISSNPTLVPTNNIFFGVAFNTWYLTVTPAFGQTGSSTVSVIVRDGAGQEATNSFLFTCNPAPAGYTRFAQTEAITIPGVAGTNGPANPYASTNTVSGLSGWITNMTMTFSGLSHERIQDVNMLLVSPNGTGVVLFSEVSGQNRKCTNVTVTLDDHLFYALPQDFALWSEPLRAADFQVGDDFPGATWTSAPVLLSSFNGASANGDWKLYVYDDTAGNDGVIQGGWSLLIATSTGPSISDITNQAITVSSNTGPIAFTINDPDTDVSTLTLTASSSNTNLVTTNNIVFGGSGTNRTVTVTPATGQGGTSTITITVSDGVSSISDTFVLSVGTPGNLPPTISAIANRTTLVGRASGPFNITISDPETATGSLILTASSSNTNLVPDGNIIFFNGGVTTLTVQPVDGVTGTATITANVSDGVNTSSVNFELTVTPPGPTSGIFDSTNALSLPLTNVASVYPSTNTVSGLAGNITQVTLTLKGLTHSASHDLEMLLVGPAGQKTVFFSHVGGGSATNVTVTVDDSATYALPPSPFAILTGTYRSADFGHGTFPAPAPAGPYGADLSPFNGTSPNGDWLLYILNDSAGTGSGSIAAWSLAITTDASNAAPTISAISNQVTTVNTSTAALSLTVDDANTAASNLVVTAASSDTNLVALGNIVFGGSDSNRTVTLTPTSNQLGTATITLTVSDGALTASNSFTITVNPAALTVSVDSFTRAYGETNPVFTGSVVGLQAGDNITADFATAADTSGPVGVYAITVTLSDPGSKLGNYTVTTNGGTLTVTNAILLITANDDAKVYNGLGYTGGNGVTYAGFMNGETNDVLGGTLSYVGTSQGATNVGPYIITPAGLTSSNYAIAFASGTLTISQAALTVTADAQTKGYGASDPALTHQITSGALAGGDSLSGALTRTAGETVGSYPITQGTLTAGPNYNLAYVGADLTITQAQALTAVASSQNPSVSGSNVTFTATITPVAPAVTTPTGSVQFLTNGVAAGSPVALVSGVANCDTAQLPAGTNTVVAQYLGDLNYAGSSNSLAQVVAVPAATPSIVGIVKNGDGSVTVTFAGTEGAEYYVQASPTIGATASWSNVATNTAGPGGQWTYTDSAVSTQTQRFFRAAKP